MRLNFNIAILVLATSAAYAQQPKPDSVRSDTVRNRYLPTGVRIGTDLLALVKSNVQDDFKGWEMNADVDFHRYFLALDYGRWERNYRTDSTATYANAGNYWRAGVDVNFLTKDPERNMFFIGFRYGRSRFSEDMFIIATDPIWGDLDDGNYSNSNVTARWYELTTGIRAKMWKMIWLGYTARFKFGLKSSGDTGMLPHDVPGYGRTDKDSYWGFNYQILVRIPFRKMPSLPPGKK